MCSQQDLFPNNMTVIIIIIVVTVTAKCNFRLGDGIAIAA